MAYSLHQSTHTAAILCTRLIRDFHLARSLEGQTVRTCIAAVPHGTQESQHVCR